MTALTRLLAVMALAGLATAMVAAAADVPTGKPEEAGFSTERLGRIREAVQRHITAGSVPGVVTLVSRRGKVVHFEPHGMNDVEAKRPMPKDAIFRLVDAAAAARLRERGDASYHRLAPITTHRDTGAPRF